MADIIDTANAFAARLNSDALARARGKSAPESHPEFNGQNCIECGEVIHPARLAHGKIRCIECQALLEEAAKRGVQ